MSKSIWQKDIDNNSKKLQNKVDVLIIGGGLSGISTAYSLMNSNLNVELIEMGKIASGVTSLTTGKLTYLQGTMFSDIEGVHGFDIAKKYVDSQIYGLNLVKNIIDENKIDCDFILNDSYIFSFKDDDEYIINKEYDLFKKANIKVEKTNKLPIEFPCKSALKVEKTAVFHPIKYISAMCKIIKDKVNLCEEVKALEIKRENDTYLVNTTKGEIKAKYVCVCTHYPFFVVPGLIPFKTHIEKSHVIASKIDKIEKFNAISIGKETYSIRYHKDKDSYLIFAGESYKMSNHIDYEDRQKELTEKFKANFNSNIDYEWSTHDITSNDILPIIGSVNSDNPNLLIATAFNKWGMINSILSGNILSSIILNKENEFINLFDPKRKISIKRTLNFLTDMVNISKIYLGTKIIKNKVFYKSNVRIENINGKSYGIYIDENNKKHIVRNLCPHMKCSLVFNYMDKTWDCPCHGSRFDIDGNVISGPSSYDIKIENNNNIK